MLKNTKIYISKEFSKHKNEIVCRLLLKEDLTKMNYWLVFLYSCICIDIKEVGIVHYEL